jgi:hypothetical protein
MTETLHLLGGMSLEDESDRDGQVASDDALPCSPSLARHDRR